MPALIEIIKVNIPAKPEYRAGKHEVVVHGKVYRFENEIAAETAFKELSRAYEEKNMDAIISWMRRSKSLAVRKEKLRANPSTSVTLAEFMRGKKRLQKTRNALIPRKPRKK